MQQGQRHRQRSADFCTQAIVFSAFASRIIDVLVATNVTSLLQRVELSQNRYGHRSTRVAVNLQPVACTLVNGHIGKDRVLISEKNRGSFESNCIVTSE